MYYQKLKNQLFVDIDYPKNITKLIGHIVFSGYRIEKLSGGELEKTWHRVVKVANHRDRISLVLFVWTDAVPSYPSKARSQDLKPSYLRNT